MSVGIHSEIKGAKTAPIGEFWYRSHKRVLLLSKKHPLKKRVLLVAVAPQGYCFGTLFSVTVRLQIAMSLVT